MLQRVRIAAFFILFTLTAIGQGNKAQFASTFLQFDQNSNPGSSVLEMRTDKIVFQKNNNLDLTSSRPYLDSIVWFLMRHHNTIIGLSVEKEGTYNIKHQHTRTGEKQSHQVVDYLTTSGINERRVSAGGYQCEGTELPDGTKNGQSKKNGVILTTIRVLSFDYQAKQ